jgi:transcriptional regulator with XRE-family HTH domain
MNGHDHPLRVAREARHWSIETLADKTGLSRRTILRAEQGHGLNPDSLRLLERCLGMSADELGLTRRRPGRPDGRSLVETSTEIDDMNRREFLRMLSMAGTLLAVPPVDGPLDWERMDYVAGRSHGLDNATADQYATLNAHLWREYASSTPKSAAFPMVRHQLDVLTRSLEESHGPAMHVRLSALAGDLWACAMTRHSFIGVYELNFGKSVPMLELADRLSQRGDRALSTRYWVNAVRAQAMAGVGELDACRRAIGTAEQVHRLNGQVHNGGWLRFDGARLSGERGACFVELRQPALAEAALTEALAGRLSTRRQGIVLADLAMVGVQRADPDQLLTHTTAALGTARTTQAPESSVGS